MKKIFSAIAATLLISALAACTAADDSTISGPRSGATTPDNGNNTKTGIAELCDDYSTMGSMSEVTVYECDDNDKLYACGGANNACQEVTRADANQILGYDDYED